MNLLLYELLIFSLLVPRSYSLQTYGRCTYECFDCDCNFNCPLNSIDLPIDSISGYDLGHCSGDIPQYDGYMLKRTNVIIKSVIMNMRDSDKFIHFNENENNFVYSIDLSNHLYDYFPISTEMSNLQKINISRNSLTEAKLSNAHELPALSEIDFSYNTINTIEGNNYEYPYKEMKVLNLSHNYLVAIPDAIFSSLSKLETLDLSYNYIDAFNVLSFEGIKNLKNLYVSHNRISNIDNSLLRFNFLEVIDFSHNAIEIIKSRDFEKLINLRNLDLSSNNLLRVEKNSFNTMSQLKVLDISINKLETIDKETFSNNGNLEDINVSLNNLKELPRDLFKGKCVSLFAIQGNHLNGALVKGTFEGLAFVTEIDLSGQQLTSIEDYAFFGLEKMTTLLLQNNNIQTLSMNAFRNLQNLAVLDLSNNLLTNIDFEKKDLISLYSLILQNNKLAQVKPEYFHSLHMLQFLDLSNNKIVQFEQNSFMSLRDLINIQISNNPVSGALEESTFDGLNSLPTLDISGTMLTAVNNGSFKGMTQLTNLNISHSNISEIQYNSFLKTGALESIDLSFNRLISFDVNTTELINLNILILNNNLLTVISSSSLKGIPRLTKLYLSHNNITEIQNEAFAEQIDLRYLDLSYNSELNLNISHIGNAPNLATMIISGIHTNINFELVEGDIPLSVLEMSHSKIENITNIVLKRFKQLETLVLSNNDIVKVESGAFSNLTRLLKLDLSFNKIKYIQPGAFKDNVLLFSLNISHNSLTAVSYGIFRGLIYLNTIDISYNIIDSLESERFYEVRSLSVLIVDHNEISSVKADDFVGTSLSKLSIGENPLTCDILVNLKKTNIPFVITAIRLDESSDENVDGVTCNTDSSKPKVKSSSSITENDKILVDIRDILRNIKTDTDRKMTEKSIVSTPAVSYFEYFSNLSKQIDKTGSENNKVLLHLSNLTSNIADTDTSTNILLEKMLKVLTSINTVRRAPIPIPKDNSTIDNLIPYINKIKQDLEDTIAVEKQNILTEVENKISSITHKKSVIFESSPNHEALSTNTASESKSLIFIEICVGIMLLILVSFVLYKFYRSGMFVPRRNSYSTRNLPEAIDNSTL